MSRITQFLSTFAALVCLSGTAPAATLNLNGTVNVSVGGSARRGTTGSGSPETGLALAPNGIGFTEYPLPTGGSPYYITVGPDGALWFPDESETGKIGKITTTGIITEYPIPSAYTYSDPTSIISGPDGALWFSMFNDNKIGKITTAGIITLYPIPTVGSLVYRITSGPDGALWFTEYSGNKIGKITTAGIITEYPVPTANVAPFAITTGPDGALWFTEWTGTQGDAQIGRITTAGAITEYPLPSANSGSLDITSGPDGALWFTEAYGDKIGRITTTADHEITEYPITPISYSVGITSGPDGALWFTEAYGNKIGRITTVGAITEYPLPSANSGVNSITTGSDGALWFTEGDGNKIGRFSPCASSALVDLCFQPNPDGYSFSNQWDAKYPAYLDFLPDDVRRTFGDAAFCQFSMSGICLPKMGALAWWAFAVAQIQAGGHCVGFATTSLRFFKGLDKPSDYQSKAVKTTDLSIDTHAVRNHISYFTSLQLTSSMMLAMNNAYSPTPNELLDQVRSAMSGNDPMILLMKSPGQNHAVMPYKIVDQGGGVFWVYVYDNTFANDNPDGNNDHLIFDRIGNTWSYYIGDTIDLDYKGTDSSHTLGALHISQFMPDSQVLPCPWCSTAVKGTSTADGSTLRAQKDDALGVNRPTDVMNGMNGTLGIAGLGHLLTTDSQGRRLGYVGTQYVSEIPGAYGVQPVTGNVPLEPIYTLPLTDTYTTLLSGQSLTQSATTSLDQFGPGYAYVVGNIPLQPTTQDVLHLAADGTQISYMASETKAVMLTLISQTQTQGNQFQVQGASIGAGQTVMGTIKNVTGQFVFNNKQAGGGSYAFQFDHQDSSGSREFLHHDIVIQATDSHYFDYAAWNGSGPLTLEIDHGSKGTIDQIIQLPNEAGDTLDVDGSGASSKYDALTDGLLLIRYMFGLTGQSLTNGALGATATRTDPTAIKAYLDGMRLSLDIDGNGQVDALTDGLMLIRYFFGLRGNSLIAGAIGSGQPTRNTAPLIETYIQSLMP